MSPFNLDAREYQWLVFTYVAPDAGFHSFTAPGVWAVTRIQAFADGTNAFTLQVARPDTDPETSQDIPVAATGCVTLEPGGYYRAGVGINGGTGALVIVEFIIQTNDGSVGPVVKIS